VVPLRVVHVLAQALFVILPLSADKACEPPIQHAPSDELEARGRYITDRKAIATQVRDRKALSITPSPWYGKVIQQALAKLGNAGLPMSGAYAANCPGNVRAIPMVSSMPWKKRSACYIRHSTYELAESAKTAQLALFAAKLLPNLPKRATGLIVWDQPDSLPFAKR
jgi:hypothetical protein